MRLPSQRRVVDAPRSGRGVQPVKQPLWHRRARTAAAQGERRAAEGEGQTVIECGKCGMRCPTRIPSLPQALVPPSISPTISLCPRNHHLPPHSTAISSPPNYHHSAPPLPSLPTPQPAPPSPEPQPPRARESPAPLSPSDDEMADAVSHTSSSSSDAGDAGPSTSGAGSAGAPRTVVVQGTELRPLWEEVERMLGCVERVEVRRVVASSGGDGGLGVCKHGGG